MMTATAPYGQQHRREWTPSDGAAGAAAAHCLRLHEMATEPPVRVRRRLLEAFNKFLQYSGTAELFVRLRDVSGAVILMYHSVARSGQATWIDPRNHLSPERFEAQVRFLSRHRRVVSMSRLCETLKAGETPAAGTVVITFDDGYLDNLTVAAPILTRFGLPATVYLATGYVERGSPQWVDRLYSAFRARSRHALRFAAESNGEFDLRSSNRCLQAYRQAAERLLARSFEERESLLSSIESQLQPAARPPRLTMNWNDVRELTRCYPSIELGVHTRGHVDLSCCAGNKARGEIDGSIEDLRRRAKVEPRHFSFPYSRARQDLTSVLRAAGFQSAVVSGTELVTAQTDPFALPRVPAPTSLTLLRFVTSGAYPRLSRALFGRA